MRARREIEIRKYQSHARAEGNTQQACNEIVRVLFDSDFKEADRTYGCDRIITGGGGAVVGGVTTESVCDDHQPWWALKLNIVSPIAVIPTSTVGECRK